MNYNELLEKADLVGMSVDEYIENYDIAGEGKQNDLAETDPPTNQNQKRPLGNPVRAIFLWGHQKLT